MARPIAETSSGSSAGDAPDGRDIESVDEDILREALVLTETRKVRRDTLEALLGETAEEVWNDVGESVVRFAA